MWKLFKKIWHKSTNVRQDEKPASLSHIHNVIEIAESPNVRRINVGLDLGTSTSKVIFTEIDTEKHYIFSFFDSSKGKITHFYPSIVNIGDKELYFGFKARDRDTGETILSFKKTLYPKAEQVTYGIMPYQFTGEQINCFYIAHILKEVTGRIRDLYSDVKIDYQIGVPVISIKDNLTIEKFRTALGIAVEMIDTLENNLSIAKYKKLYTESKLAYSRIPEEDKSVFAYPESFAALQAAVYGGGIAEGIISIIDVGASTTDISVSLCSENTFCLYSARSNKQGVDGICDEIIRIHQKSPSITNEMTILEIRNSIENCSDGELQIKKDGEDYLVINSSDYISIINDIVNPILNEYKYTFEHARRYVLNSDEINYSKLLLIGGGNRIAKLRQRFEEYEPFSPQMSIYPEIISLQIPDDLSTLDDETFINDFDLLVTAYGLSFHYAQSKEVTEGVQLERDIWRRGESFLDRLPGDDVAGFGF